MSHSSSRSALVAPGTDIQIYDIYDHGFDPKSVTDKVTIDLTWDRNTTDGLWTGYVSFSFSFDDQAFINWFLKENPIEYVQFSLSVEVDAAGVALKTIEAIGPALGLLHAGPNRIFTANNYSAVSRLLVYGLSGASSGFKMSAKFEYKTSNGKPFVFVSSGTATLVALTGYMRSVVSRPP